VCLAGWKTRSMRRVPSTPEAHCWQVLRIDARKRHVRAGARAIFSFQLFNASLYRNVVALLPPCGSARKMFSLHWNLRAVLIVVEQWDSVAHF
jgi:hypothetical protein